MRRLLKGLSAAIILLIIFQLAGCGSTKQGTASTSEGTTGQSSATTQASASDKYKFPLKEPKTISAMVYVNPYLKDINGLQQLKDLQAKTNVTIDWKVIAGTDSAAVAEKINLSFASGDYPEMVFGNILQDIDISKLAASKVLIPIEEYINKDLTPNISALFEKVPSTKGISTFTNGHIYSIPTYIGMESQYLENRFLINKVWLEKLKLSVPKTTDELYTVLKAFKEKDPNGNGKADEIPITFSVGDSSAYPEALLSCWGYAAKPATYDSFLTVRNGKVYFAPALPEFKEMVKYYAKLYKEGILDIEAYTHTSDQYFAKLGAKEAIVGFAWRSGMPFNTNQNQYITIPPMNAPGHDVVWRIHPGSLGLKNYFCITNKAKDPELAMAWVDTFYTMESTLTNWYGPVGTVFTKENGMYKFNDPPQGMESTIFYKTHTINYKSIPGVFFQDQIGKLVNMNKLWTAAIDDYDIYKPYLDKETWPRPYYSDTATQKISELRTDILNTVNQREAGWVTGATNVDSDWNKYLEDLKKMGIDEYIKINQDAYDIFAKGMGK